MAKPTLTPMLQQYQKIKEQHPDCILFYRMGDFYEMFFDDAKTAAPLLEVTLTSRDKNAADPIPMCGVPYHAAQNYIQKLIAAGKKVAICEQMEAASATKGLVRRAVTRIVTPALVGDPELTLEDKNTYLALLHKGSAGIELGFVDLFSGEQRMGIAEPQQVKELFLSFSPEEVLVDSEIASFEWFRSLCKHFPKLVITIRPEYFTQKKDSLLAATIAYLKETQKTDQVGHLKNPAPIYEKARLSLDHTTLSSLEVLRTLNGSVEGPTLFNVLNFTKTPMGRRLLKDWLSRPLTDKIQIEDRLEAVNAFLTDATFTSAMIETLSKMRDLERLASKLALGLALPRDLVAIGSHLALIPSLKKLLSKSKAPRLNAISKHLVLLKKLTAKLQQALEPDPPNGYREGGIFQTHYHDEINSLRNLSTNAKATIAEIEARERTNTQIPTLKIKFNKVFGYMIEVTKAHVSKVPEHFIRKQTIANGERYFTEELKAFEQKALSAESKLKALEEDLYLELREEVKSEVGEISRNAGWIAEIDVLLSFSQAARHNGYHRPHFSEKWNLNIEEGRHPVVEALVEAGKFVPNSITFDSKELRTLIITGPNMAGKSTIMRQVALIALMAQSGCFVPASSANLPILDAIYTRIGSADDLAKGQSTFMVEMTEMARILEAATENSLILIDEIGRGTSTYDGLSLAWSLIEYLHKEIKAKTLFATHFHEVTALEKALEGVRNTNVKVEHWKEGMVFLHKLSDGICPRSYGIEVAGLAQLPDPVLSRAKEILGRLESRGAKKSGKRSGALESQIDQMSFF